MTCEFCHELKPLVIADRFCSMSCKSKWWIRVKNEERGHHSIDHEFICKQCKLTHIQRMSSHRVKNYPPNFCSYSCRSLWQAANKIGTAGKTNEERFGEWVEKFGIEEANRRWEEFRSKVWTLDNFRKGYETKKEEGTLFYSKPEEIAAKILEEHFEIERQVRVENWHVDFLVDQKIYVEIDGIYWHGLNRPIEEIRKSSKSSDKTISKKYDKDRMQDQYFKENGLRLIRVTDVEILENAYIVVERVKNVIL